MSVDVNEDIIRRKEAFCQIVVVVVVVCDVVFHACRTPGASQVERYAVARYSKRKNRHDDAQTCRKRKKKARATTP
jgi:hypothetical protein